jgi:hypothetical protein
MAQDKNADTSKDMQLQDLEWPDSPPADDSAQQDAAPTDSTGADKAFYDQHFAATENADGSVSVQQRNEFVGTYSASGKDLHPDPTLPTAPFLERGGLAGDVVTMGKDTDGDGITDFDENRRGWNPNNADTDGDGMTDGEEFEKGLDPAIPQPATATADDRDGDGLTDVEETELGGSFAVDVHAAAGRGTDKTELPKEYYEVHKGQGAIADASIRTRWNIPATPAEEQQLLDTVGDKIFSDNPLDRLAGETALAGFDDAKIPQKAKDDATAFVNQMNLDITQKGLTSDNPADIGAALRHDAMLGNGLLTDAQRTELTGKFNASMGLGGQDQPGASQPGAGTGTGTGGGTGQPGQPGQQAGTGSGSSRAGDLDTGSRRIAPDTSDAAPPATAPADTPPGPAPSPATPTPTPAPAPAASDPGGVGSMGSRGNGGGTSLPNSIGPLNTTPANVPPTGTAPRDTHQTSPTGRGGEVADQSADPINPVAGKDGSVDHYEQQHADGSKSIYTADGTYFGTTQAKDGSNTSSAADDGTNTDAGSTDGDSDNEDPADDTPDDIPTSADSDEATAYVNPDADAGGGLSLLDTGGRAFVAGGGFTDGGRDDLASIDLSGATIADHRNLYAHVDPDADSSGGGVFVGVGPIDGGGFSDGGRPELAQIDLTGLTPHVPHSGTDALVTSAFGADAAFGADVAFGDDMQSDGGVFTTGGGGGDGGGVIVDGGGPYAPGVAGGDGSAFTVGLDSMSISIDDNAFSLDATALQIDDFSAQTAGMSLAGMDGAGMDTAAMDGPGDPGAPGDPGGAAFGGDGDGLPFP